MPNFKLGYAEKKRHLTDQRVAERKAKKAHNNSSYTTNVPSVSAIRYLAPSFVTPSSLLNSLPFRYSCSLTIHARPAAESSNAVTNILDQPCRTYCLKHQMSDMMLPVPEQFLAKRIQTGCLLQEIFSVMLWLG